MVSETKVSSPRTKLAEPPYKLGARLVLWVIREKGGRASAAEILEFLNSSYPEYALSQAMVSKALCRLQMWREVTRDVSTNEYVICDAAEI